MNYVLRNDIHLTSYDTSNIAGVRRHTQGDMSELYDANQHPSSIVRKASALLDSRPDIDTVLIDFGREVKLVRDGTIVACTRV